MVTVEQTEHVEIGLDVLVRGEHGGIICWCYDMASAEMIANAMNNVWKDADGDYKCSGCDLQSAIEKGTKAWADVEDHAQWVDDLRGGDIAV